MLLSIISLPSFARQKFQFTIGNDVHILSDKAFRKSKDQIFEAVGNVIITHGQNAIYGEKASVSFASGEAEVVGNVRYIGPNMTLYGSKLNYNFKSLGFKVQNARILSDNYVVLGKEINRVSENVITGVDAEYTTCKDCPESWSIFGKKVHITIGEYIRIYSAYIKVKGVVVMYIPYILLPIKKNRETGLLFPGFGLDSDEGASFRQPLFWAINDSVDMTLTPGVLGKRGWGNELQFRQSLSGNSWYEMNSLQSYDRLYEPFKQDLSETGHHRFRYLGNYEHHMGSFSDFNHHLFVSKEGDLDVQRDFDFFADNTFLGTESEGSGFFEFRRDLFYLGLEGSFNRNTLYPEPREFDDRYVQILPGINFSSVPVSLFQSDIPGLARLEFGLNGKATVFKQNHVDENVYIRNATRYNIDPYLEWNLGDLGPIHLKSTATLDYQGYHFPHETDKTYRKVGLVHETEASLTLEKLIGVSYIEELPIEDLKVKNEKESDTDKFLSRRGLLGQVPKFKTEFSKKKVKFGRRAYRHQQVYKIKHFYLQNQTEKGNDRFKTQIREEDGKGQFDYRDSLKERVHTLNTASNRTELPLQNTVELQWNNSFIRKVAKPSYGLTDGKGLRDNFTYERVSYFDISQGYDFSVLGEKLEDHLTRLKVIGGVTIQKWSFSFSEYYFYKESKHILSFDQNFRHMRGDLGVGLYYDSFTTPSNKYFKASTRFDLTDMLGLGLKYDYDIDQKRTNESEYYAVYSPANNCWKLELSLKKSITGKKYGFNFLINFNENSFTSLSDL